MNLPGICADGADLSDCGRYRYRLWRDLGNSKRRVCFLMLNASTAGALTNDPTVRRCIGFTRSFGHGWLDVANLFPLRSPHPEDVWSHEFSAEVLDRNAAAILRAASGAELVVAAWGTWSTSVFEKQRDAVVELVRSAGVELYCVGKTADGSPCHPLYVPSDRLPVRWHPPRES